MGEMEANKQMGSSSSSFTTELFGPADSSSSGLLGSIFAPQSKVLGRESLCSGKKQESAIETWNYKPLSSDDVFKSNESYSKSVPNRDASSIYQDQRVQHPCNLSSSIYYGGQDVYHHPQNSQSSSRNAVFKKDVTEDDVSALRGNWWQGGPYY